LVVKTGLPQPIELITAVPFGATVQPITLYGELQQHPQQAFPPEQ
jgi:hypothetical protein